MKPRLLDLFCGAGGATKGYQRAGFYVVGVDIAPQPHYCGDEFVQSDALEYFDIFGRGFDAYHASPPCQKFTQMSARWRGKGGKTDAHLDWLTPTLERFRELPEPWVVENVVGAKALLRSPLRLHGGMFGLGVHRPRLFESNMLVLSPLEPLVVEPVGVYGEKPDGRRLWTRLNGNRKKRSIMRAAKSLQQAQEVMGMDWADWHGVKEAIPPAYTEWIGKELLRGVAAGCAPRTHE